MDKNNTRPGGNEPEDRDVAVVALGASAGGLTALRDFFNAFPPDPHFAVVVVTHLDPTHESHMAEILSRYTDSAVHEPRDQELLTGGNVYTIPPGKTLAVENGRFVITSAGQRPGISLPIDVFLRSLANDAKERAIAVILSGTGTDGCHGIKEIKSESGLVLVQDPQTAEHDGMPRAAISTGVVDRVLTVKNMPKVIRDYVHQVLQRSESYEHLEGSLKDVLAVLYARGGHDFRCYKKNTLLRRVYRRMALTHVGNINDYIALMRDQPDEIAALAKDLLIGVTDFFRDPEVWDTLRDSVIPEIVRHKLPDIPIRVWIAGCATGEEAYSMAMLIIETAEKHQHRGKIQVFATDIDKVALDVGRLGTYLPQIATTVSAERLRRFFNKVGENYQVKKELREAVVFAPQNLISDSPFSRLDLISCRNLLIYLEPELQKRLFTLFHFALLENGVLVLGTSETVPQQNQGMFIAISKKLRIYRRTGQVRRQALDFPLQMPEIPAHEQLTQRRRSRENVFADITRQILLSRYAPASVLINRDYQVLYFFGNTQDFLAQPTGQPTNDLLSMTTESLRTKLRAAVHKAAASGELISVSGAQTQRGDKGIPVQITVLPLQQDDEQLLLVSFRIEPKEETTPKPSARLSGDEADVIRVLEEELRRNKDELHSTIEELEASNEELKVANEEAMSMNEELQSANEELETSKEELQSLNEELTTINNQLETKISELEATSNDLHNLLSSTNIATVFLDKDFHIKRFTPATSRLMRLIPSDVGRSISDITSRCSDPTLLSDAQRVMDALVPIEKEIISDTNEWYIRRVQPYRTHDNRIEGVVITHIDISDRKHREEEQARLAAIIESSSEAIISKDLEGRVASWNAAAERLFGYTASEALGRQISFLTPPGWPDELPMVIERLRKGERVPPFETVRRRKNTAHIHVAVTVSAIRDGNGQLIGFSEIERDITERREAEQALRDSEQKLRAQKDQLAQADRRKDEFLATLGHELRNPLASLSNTVNVLKAKNAPRDPERINWGIDMVERQTKRLLHLVDDLLDIARITNGKIELRRTRVGLNQIVEEAVQSTRGLVEKRQLDLKVTLTNEPLWIDGDQTRLVQVFHNLLSNAAWYTEAPGQIYVTVSRSGTEAIVHVRDTGIGIPADFLPHIFEMFTQGSAGEHKQEKGLGIGLTLVRQLIELHGGRVTATSAGAGKGAEFTVYLPT